MSSRPFKQVLAAATGSDGGLGKIGTIPIGGVLYVRCDVAPNTALVKWTVQGNKAHAVQAYHAHTKVEAYTITLTDATAVDDTDTFELAGLTFTAETTEGDASAAARKWYHPDQPVGAANLAALLAHATYGVPGIGAITVTAPAATDVLTIAAGTAPVLHFNQGTSAANEIAFATTILAGLEISGSATTGVADNSATAGATYDQWVDRIPYAYLKVTNSDGAAALTALVSATQIAAS